MQKYNQLVDGLRKMRIQISRVNVSGGCKFKSCILRQR